MRSKNVAFDQQMQFPREFKDGRKVWLKSIVGAIITGANWLKVAKGRKDASSGWMYQLKEPNDELYNNGEWVAQDRLEAADSE